MLLRLALFPLLLGCGAAKEKAITDAVQTIWNEGDMTLIDQNYEAELAHEVKRFVTENRELYPDLEVEILDVIVKGDRYVTVWRVSGTHKFVEKTAVMEGVSVRRREGGVFVEEAMFYDMKSVYDQLGFRVLPPEGFGPWGEVEVAAQRGAPEAEPERERSEGEEESSGRERSGSVPE